MPGHSQVLPGRTGLEPASLPSGAFTRPCHLPPTASQPKGQPILGPKPRVLSFLLPACPHAVCLSRQLANRPLQVLQGAHLHRPECYPGAKMGYGPRPGCSVLGPGSYPSARPTGGASASCTFTVHGNTRSHAVMEPRDTPAGGSRGAPQHNCRAHAGPGATTAVPLVQDKPLRSRLLHTPAWGVTVTQGTAQAQHTPGRAQP